MSLVEITLAHPLNEWDARALHLPVDADYPTGARVVVTLDAASSLEANGIAAVNDSTGKVIRHRVAADTPLGLVKDEEKKSEEAPDQTSAPQEPPRADPGITPDQQPTPPPVVSPDTTVKSSKTAK